MQPTIELNLKLVALRYRNDITIADTRGNLLGALELKLRPACARFNAGLSM